jgi:ferredoxin
VVLTVRVDHDRCTGSGNCALVLPEVFELDEMANKARVIDGTPPPDLERWVRQAAEQCPTKAITIGAE